MINMPAIAEQTDLEKFSHGLRDGENGIPEAYPRTLEHQAYHWGYDFANPLSGKPQINEGPKRDYRG